jgi:ABC-type glycerol-3-phosphate transport system substrate-binding protein
MSETCEKAITILQKTNDGDDLDPMDLKLVELAVNDFLNDEGKQAFQKLFDDVNKGYVAPWFHGIENMRRDQVGYVYWKGKQVEHYDSPWAYTADGKKSAEELAARCRHLESIGVTVNPTTTVWQWEKYAPKEIAKTP